ncbi:MAG: rubrerythrin family protein [Deltaproteobacteria bacterium]|nr:rubrerythrin family protein [Deltaproteobacteria bacterium]
MDERIREALHTAYTGEAKAALRLKLYAEKADKEGYAQVAKLFRVISFSEEIHGKRALRLLKDVGNTEENLRLSFESEQNVAEVAYSEMVKLANDRGDSSSALHFSQSRDVEEVHAKLYKSALDDMMQDRMQEYFVCSVCGYVAEDAVPDVCPVCGVSKEKFIHFE